MCWCAETTQIWRLLVVNWTEYKNILETICCVAFPRDLKLLNYSYEIRFCFQKNETVPLKIGAVHLLHSAYSSYTPLRQTAGYLNGSMCISPPSFMSILLIWVKCQYSTLLTGQLEICIDRSSSIISSTPRQERDQDTDTQRERAIDGGNRKRAHVDEAEKTNMCIYEQEERVSANSGKYMKLWQMWIDQTYVKYIKHKSHK